TAERECHVGTYASDTGSSTCTDATTGYCASNDSICVTTAAISQMATTAIADGFYFSDSDHTVESCPASGYYCTGGVKTVWSTCVAGSSISTPGSTILDVACAECLAGTFQPNPGLSSCTDATAGHYVADTGSIEENTCPVGYYTSSTGTITCSQSSIGHYVSTTGQTVQTACPSGTHQIQRGQPTCPATTAITAGSYFSASTHTVEPCLRGYSCMGGAMTACTAGTFQPNPGLSICTDARAGH
ncbi:uncharacterized protein METZ01_LOCUS477777, partial [marine metagenome]